MGSEVKFTQKSKSSMIRIVRGETIEGIFWILVYQYGRAEFRCQDIETWNTEEFGHMIESSASSLTYQEIKQLVKDYK